MQGLDINDRSIVGAEIGVGSGPCSAQLLTRLPTLHLWAVDHWPVGYPTERGGPMTAEWQARVRATYMTLVPQFAPRLTVLERPSLEGAAFLDDGTLDFVFIDADHSYEGCLADIDAWTPKVRRGGWIIGHDYCAARYPGVIKAVEESFKDFAIGDDFVWMARA